MTLDGREVFENQIQKAQTMNEKTELPTLKLKTLHNKNRTNKVKRQATDLK